MDVQTAQSPGNKRVLPVILLPLKEREDESDQSLFRNDSLSSQQMERAGEGKTVPPEVDQIRRFLRRGDQLNHHTFKKLKEDKQINDIAKPDRSSASLYKSNRHLEFPLNEDEKQAQIKRLYLSNKKQTSKLNFRTALYKFNKTSQEVQTDGLMIPQGFAQTQAPLSNYHHLHKPSYLTIDADEGTRDRAEAKLMKDSIFIEPDEEEDKSLPQKEKKGTSARIKTLSTSTNQNKHNVNSYLRAMGKLDYQFHSNFSKYSQRYKEYGEQQTVFSKTIDVKPLRPLNETLSNLGEGNSDFKSQPTTAILEKNDSRATQQLPGGITIKHISTTTQNSHLPFGLKAESRIEKDPESIPQQADRQKLVSAIQQVTNEKDSSMLPQYSREAKQYSNSRENQRYSSGTVSRMIVLHPYGQVKEHKEGSGGKGLQSKVSAEKKSEMIQVPSLHELKVGQSDQVQDRMIHPIRQNFGTSEMNWIQKFYHPKSDFLSKLSASNFQIKKYQNGVYFGELSPEGKKQGKGVIFYFSGKIYEGDFLNDLKHGLGHEYFPDASSYRGDFKEGMRHGRGVFEWSNREVYDGQWERSKKTGSGMWKSPEGESYIGEWKRDKVEGFGVFVMANGSRYEGEFKNSLKHGTGTERFSNGETYVGSYQRNRPNGEGEYYWANGDYYKGFFSNGLRHRQGYFRQGKTGVQYRGEYHNDKKCGFGDIDYGKELIYRGNFENNFRHGYGELLENGKLKYRGYWVNDHQIDDENHQPLPNDPQSSKVAEVIREESERIQSKAAVKPVLRPRGVQRVQRIKRVQRVQVLESVSSPKKTSVSPKGEGEGYKRACGCNRKH